MYIYGDCRYVHMCMYSTTLFLLYLYAYRTQKEPALSPMHCHDGTTEDTQWVVSDACQVDSISQQALIAANKSAAAKEV